MCLVFEWVNMVVWLQLIINGIILNRPAIKTGLTIEMRYVWHINILCQGFIVQGNERI